MKVTYEVGDKVIAGKPEHVLDVNRPFYYRITAVRNDGYLETVFDDPEHLPVRVGPLLTQRAIRGLS